MLTLELGPTVANIKCSCCDKFFKSVHGYIKKDDYAHSVYFATLQTSHDVEVGLTVSIGKWWSDTKKAIKQRNWMYMRLWPSESGSGFEIRIEEPDGSRHFGLESLGTPISCSAVSELPQLEDFFDVAHFVIDNDPAVLSYLSNKEINIAGRTCSH